MTDLPILFSAPMIRALAADRKTQTRRLPTRLRGKGQITELGPSDTKGYDWRFRDRRHRWQEVSHARLLELLPWQVGDRLWVREAWRTELRNDEIKPSDLKIGAPVYREAADVEAVPECAGRLRAGFHMPRWASRFTLIVEEARVERLQDISEGDVKAEGLVCLSKDQGRVWKWGLPESDGLPGAGGWQWQMWRVGHKPAYAQLWDQINGPDAWAANPIVSATTFRAIKVNIDSPEARP